MWPFNSGKNTLRNRPLARPGSVLANLNAKRPIIYNYNREVAEQHGNFGGPRPGHGYIQNAPTRREVKNQARWNREVSEQHGNFR